MSGRQRSLGLHPCRGEGAGVKEGVTLSPRSHRAPQTCLRRLPVRDHRCPQSPEEEKATVKDPDWGMTWVRAAPLQGGLCSRQAGRWKGCQKGTRGRPEPQGAQCASQRAFGEPAGPLCRRMPGNPSPPASSEDGGSSSWSGSSMLASGGEPRGRGARADYERGRAEPHPQLFPSAWSEAERGWAAEP